jgi:hypothetical protein
MRFKGFERRSTEVLRVMSWISRTRTRTRTKMTIKDCKAASVLLSAISVCIF